MSAHPNTEQADRDRLADIGLADFDNRTGTDDDGHHAQHVEEVTPS